MKNGFCTLEKWNLTEISMSDFGKKETITITCKITNKSEQFPSQSAFEICPFCGRERGSGENQCNFTITKK